MTPLLKTITALMLVLLFVVPTVPPAPRSRRPPPQPVSRPAAAPVREALLGVHGRMTDEVEQWKIERIMDMIRAMGATWVVEYFPWAYLEPSPGRFDWYHADMVVEAAASRGLKLIARLDMVPEWARPPGSSSRYLGEDRYQDYARFAATFAERYRESVHDLVVWNEPNLSFEWGYRPVDPAAYVRLLRQAYQAIKAVAPEVSVVAAGLAPTLDTGTWGLNDLVYLQRMYEAGAAPYFDKLAVHTYGWRSPPDAPPAPDRINFARAELLWQIMVASGDGEKKVLITESGWNDHPRWTKAVRPAQRVNYSLRAVDKVASQWPWAQALAFWSFKLPRDAHNYNDYFTFVTSDFRVKPIYEAFRLRAQRLHAQAGQAGAGGPL